MGITTFIIVAAILISFADRAERSRNERRRRNYQQWKKGGVK